MCVKVSTRTVVRSSRLHAPNVMQGALNTIYVKFETVLKQLFLPYLRAL
jgi:hypothetical protein